jgi:hypothetical protein
MTDSSVLTLYHGRFNAEDRDAFREWLKSIPANRGPDGLYTESDFGALWSIAEVVYEEVEAVGDYWWE